MLVYCCEDLPDEIYATHSCWKISCFFYCQTQNVILDKIMNTKQTTQRDSVTMRVFLHHCFSAAHLIKLILTWI